MTKKIMAILMFCALTIADIPHIKAQTDVFFYDLKTEKRTSMAALIEFDNYRPAGDLEFGNYTDIGDLEFEGFELTSDVPVGSPLLILTGLALAFKALKRNK